MSGEVDGETDNDCIMVEDTDDPPELRPDDGNKENEDNVAVSTNDHENVEASSTEEAEDGMHRRPPDLGFTTFNFAFYENLHLSLKKCDFPTTLQKCKYKNILT